MKALITGITGFCGSHLAEALVARGDEVWGLCRRPENDENLAAVRGRVRLRACDLSSDEQVCAVLQEIRPSTIFHMAGEASAAYSLQHPLETFRHNIIGTVNLLEACRVFKPDRIVLFTTSEMYGIVTPQEIPLTESSPLRPVHPYGVSKSCVHLLGRLYSATYQFPIVEARAFNQIGPRQRPGFVLPDFAQQIAEMTLGRREPIVNVGNLADERDFTDVRDAVRAYLLLAERGRIGDAYHICSGKAVPVQAILDILIKRSGAPIRVEVDPTRLRPSRMPIIQGSFEKLRSETGWAPQISLETSVHDTLEYWLQKLRQTS